MTRRTPLKTTGDFKEVHMSRTPLTHQDVERALKRMYPRVHHVLHVARAPLHGGISNVQREQMRVYFQNQNLGVEHIDLVAKGVERNEAAIMEALDGRKALRGRIPKPILLKKKTLLYRRLWGDEFRRFPFSERPRDLPRLCAEVGNVLARIHNTPIPDGVAQRIRTLKQRRRNLRTLEKKFPEVIARFNLNPPDSPAGRHRQVLMHGDFQPSNLIMTLPDAHIGVIDFAAGGAGDQAFDVADFLAHTELMLRGNLPARTIQRSLDVFLNVYKNRVRSLGKHFDEALRVAKFDALLSILGATIAHIKPDDRNYEPLLTNIYHQFYAD